MDIVHLDFSKNSETVSYNVLLSKSRRCAIDKWTLKRIKNWLPGRAQRVVISGA